MKISQLKKAAYVAAFNYFPNIMQSVACLRKYPELANRSKLANLFVNQRFFYTTEQFEKWL